ncbi:MAG: tyrosine--tRNA ligase [Deltaproteobacteria bacterium]|nr:tyrosine--tRNA ligase [Deltaproteobacteria bacterium]
MSGRFLPVQEQLEILTRGTVSLEVKAEFVKKLEYSFGKDKPLLVKAGFDPTAPDLHLGHTVLITKMRQFQKLGHRVVFLIGDFTGRIGDPTGKNTTRPPLTEDEILANAATYKRQVFKILDPDLTEVRFNSEWLQKMSFDDVIRLASKYTVARMIERDDFENRLKSGQPISMHELLYPLSQGYDSVALKADIELGGTDQRFNLLVGRELMQKHGLAPQCIMTLPILEGTDGTEVKDEAGNVVGVEGPKMSKSLGNYIGVEEGPEEQFGKLMSICDGLMWRYFELLSEKSAEEIATLKDGHPRDAKVALAQEIVARFHSDSEAEQAHSHFRAVVNPDNKHSVPDDAPRITVCADCGSITLIDAMVEASLVKSKGEARRMVGQNAVSVDGDRITDAAMVLDTGTHAVKVGRRKYAHISVE